MSSKKVRTKKLNTLSLSLLLISTIFLSPQTHAAKLQFQLTDTYGRIVSSEDYVGVPVFLEFGACW